MPWRGAEVCQATPAHVGLLVAAHRLPAPDAQRLLRATEECRAILGEHHTADLAAIWRHAAHLLEALEVPQPERAIDRGARHEEFRRVHRKARYGRRVRGELMHEPAQIREVGEIVERRTGALIRVGIALTCPP
jgi:hypothetical protein